jgi:ubiquinone/menaquinone biosynthesis C-methylase UbiE
MKNSSVQREIEYQERVGQCCAYGLQEDPRRNPDRLHINHFLDYFTPSRRILELGCGNGRFSFLLAALFPQSTFVCTDVSAFKIRKCNLANTYANLTFCVADSSHLPFGNETFDSIAGFYILHHLPDLCAAVKEIKRVLKKDGCYVGCEPNCYNPYIFLRIASRVNLSPNERAICPHVYRSCFEGYGFAVLLNYFFPRYPGIKHRFLSSCCAIRAQREEVNL